MGLQPWQAKSWTFFNELPPVIMYTIFTPISTISCCGTTTHSPSRSPNACCPSSWYRSNRFPGTISCISTICHSVYSVIIHDSTITATPGPLNKIRVSPSISSDEIFWNRNPNSEEIEIETDGGVERTIRAATWRKGDQERRRRPWLWHCERRSTTSFRYEIWWSEANRSDSSPPESFQLPADLFRCSPLVRCY